MRNRDRQSRPNGQTFATTRLANHEATGIRTGTSRRSCVRITSKPEISKKFFRSSGQPVLQQLRHLDPKPLAGVQDAAPHGTVGVDDDARVRPHKLRILPRNIWMSSTRCSVPETMM